MSSFPFIFTFYSFKGGVGRSMALLNVGYALASRGRRVLLIDMDLEAPGLSRFLLDSDELALRPPDAKRHQFDVLDLLAWAKDFAVSRRDGRIEEEEIRRQGPALSNYAIPVKREKLDVESLRPRLGRVGQIDVIAAMQPGIAAPTGVRSLPLTSCNLPNRSLCSRAALNTSVSDSSTPE